MKKNREVFVAGVPQAAKVENVLAYFSKFGSIVSIKAASHSEGKTHLKMEVADRTTFEAITKPGRPHLYEGRSLIVKPFIAGLDLIRENIKMNRKRVIAKSVPSSLDATDFKAWLDLAVGPVLSMYEFRSNLPNAFERNFKSYSILFHDKQTAQRLINIGEYMFPLSTRPTTFEKFKPKKNKVQTHSSKVKYQNSINPFSGIGLASSKFGYKRSQEGIQNLPQKVFPKTSFEITGERHEKTYEIEEHGVQTVIRRPLQVNDQPSFYFLTKPTSKDYWTGRTSTIGHRANHENILFRILRPRLMPI